MATEVVNVHILFTVNAYLFFFIHISERKKCARFENAAIFHNNQAIHIIKTVSNPSDQDDGGKIRDDTYRKCKEYTYKVVFMRLLEIPAQLQEATDTYNQLPVRL
jgi:hypothetical protein